MEKSKTVPLRARRFEREREMLIFVEADDKPGSPTVFQMPLSDDDDKILRIGEELPRTAWIRCAPD